uniref:Uncharacterized protein n=1 Tax=Ciona savignyi TaxID=51511 RepID=H2YWW7_CIOSA
MELPDEIYDGAELPEGDQNHSSVTRSSTTSRSYADLSDEEHCNVTNNSEVCDKIEEHCDITTNGLHETPNGIPTFNSNTSNSQLSSSAPKRIESRRSEPSLPISASDNIMSQQPKTTQAEINGHVMQRQPDVTSST